MAIGAREGKAADSAGRIDAQEIVFGTGDGTLTLNHTSEDFTLAASLHGSGVINALSGESALTADNTAFSGDISIEAPATLVISEQHNIGANDIHMSGGTLSIDTSHDWSLVNTLTGQGTLAISTAGNAFSFDTSTLTNNFSGTLALENTAFSLDGTNTAALRRSTLALGTGSVVGVGEGRQILYGLRFDGGTLVAGEVSPGQTTTDRDMHATGVLDISGQGTVQLTVGSEFSHDTPVPDTRLPLMKQDEENILVRLATGENVTGSGGSLTPTDQAGNVISNGVTAGITQAGSVVARGTYDYRLTGGENNDGLYVGYGLTQVELLATGNEALVLDAAGQSGTAADLSARVTGSGDLAIDTGEGSTVSLSNLDNDYTGNTTVHSGTLRMDNDSVLGSTAALQLAADTVLDMNGHRQTVGMLEAAGGSSLNLGGGALTVAQGGTAGGTLTGDGALTLAEGTLEISENNPELRATTTINRDATAVLSGAAGLGIGDIINAGILALRAVSGEMVNVLSDAGSLTVQDGSDVRLSGNNTRFSGNIAVLDNSRLTIAQADQLGSASVTVNGTLAVDTDADWQLLNALSGSGGLEKRGTGVVILTSAAAYTGQTDITGGGLILGSGDAPVTLQSELVNIATGAWLSGKGGTAGTVNNAGSLFVGNPQQAMPLMASATAPASAGSFTVGGDLNNSGDVSVGGVGDVAGNSLTIKGNYVGDNGALFFNTVLSGDSSLTDHLTVNGDTSGTTRVSVLNAGGTGAQTLNGIELIQVNGVSAGEFTQEGRIVAGAYDYILVRGDGQSRGNWYLMSSTPSWPEMPGEPGEERRRPEAGSYTANLTAANNMFITRLHDRMGGTPYTDGHGEYRISSLWMRQEGGHNRARDRSGQLATQSNRYVMQLGGDLTHWRDAEAGSLRLGVMAGYGNNKSHTRSSATGYTSRGSVGGYTTGIYGTWFMDENEKMGLYVDSWAQYSWFSNSVKGDGLGSETYKSKGFTASVESGYTFLMGRNEAKTKTFYLQPKVQATWMGVKADEHSESNGTRVSGEGNDNLQSRLGARVTLEGQNGKKQTFRLYTEASWLHNTQKYGVAMNGAEVELAGAKNIAELKAGVEGNLSRSVNVWGSAGQHIGDKGYSDTSVTLGLKYSF
ncbi:autotransporter outer membrane beta-barrel domain-containing protein [Enterobacter ludwigii]